LPLSKLLPASNTETSKSITSKHTNLKSDNRNEYKKIGLTVDNM